MVVNFRPFQQDRLENDHVRMAVRILSVRSKHPLADSRISGGRGVDSRGLVNLHNGILDTHQGTVGGEQHRLDFQGSF